MISFVTASLDVPHGFFTRAGGVSPGPYASLNCGRSGQDDPANVAENRARAVMAIGGHRDRLAGLRQVHGAVAVTSPDPEGPFHEADAMVTDQPGLALGIITADCAPVLFSSADGRIVGAAHAGWRGAAAGVLEQTAALMRRMGASKIVAAIGPCIHRESYEVGLDMRTAVLASGAESECFFSAGRPGHWHFDLPGYCAARLAMVGIDAAILPHDTLSDETAFFSHRRRTLRGEGAGGHQISIIMVRS
ncbi:MULTISPECIES: peptidoglycan editing factor PgeF [Acidiphilium]|jgi:YfiH family protein|uniref:Purine nucleoside phosphorylase n=1 Tax=Acidiphilium multivorum (strain DSM 11245 / JCM 8867 / NBRC 100883 / AIU 301) TaxID=926570 RepID=F0J3K9_ACIMA|nr:MULTISPECIES: peptidoglycan editing factor PgeF [Acidiphilium]KDM68676.1 laccase domain-containing protein [Acidiphilium sp. JA12-A1]MBS3024414.1 peptidoglycan editing factor PgeF [Acidiphilium multivorum]UNC13100.1 peptidoglycan editing factor PgeF [Acidiphilium multivorum]BAJ79865.1 hypothetical protein ACMV_05180 [Acidiphilium multivorum AIU301]GAN73592.1 hypothetical protein Apmu_0094_05 [Acidiphilium multivorum AIU301]